MTDTAIKDAKNYTTTGAYQQAYSALTENTAPGRSDTGVLVDVDNTLGLAAVWEAVSQISGHLAGLPLNVMRNTNGGKEIAPNHPVHRLFNDRPNSWQTPFNFRELLMAHALIQGNGRALIIRNGLGQPIALEPLYPWYTYTYIYEGEKFHVSYTHPYYPGTQPPPSEVGGGLVAHPDADVLHIPGLSYNGFWGMHLIQTAKDVLGTGIAAQGRVNAGFLNTVMPGFLIEVPPMWNAQQRAEFRRDWEQNYSGSRNAGKMKLLPAGFKAHQANVTAQDAQLAELNELSTEQIRRLFLLPQEAGGTVYKSLTERATQYVNNCLGRWFKKWTEEIRLKLFSQRERLSDTYCMQFDTMQLIKGDPNSLADYTGKLRQQGLISGNEGREMHGLNLADDPALDSYSNPNITTTEDVQQETETETAAEQDNSRNLARIAVGLHFRNLIAGEVKSVNSRAAKPMFLDEIERYYHNHKEKLFALCNKLDIPVKIAREHCRHSKDQLLEIAATCEPDQLAENVYYLTQEWEARAEEFIDGI